MTSHSNLTTINQKKQRPVYRTGVGIMLLNKDNDVFVGKRIDEVVEAWQMPQGGVDYQETPIQASLRELNEETGVVSDDVSLIYETQKWYKYELPIHLQQMLWRGMYVGQKQKWFVFRYLGKDEDINIQTAHPEFVSWKWIKFDQLSDIIVPFKKNMYQAIMKETRHIIQR